MESTNLPNWIKYTAQSEYYVTFTPLKCQRCNREYYPRIMDNGKININTCPSCKSKLWNVSK